MSQSPISILQEFMVKNKKDIPTYECIENRLVGLNDHEFTVRVKIDELSAEGKGRTKKDAKNNAAKEMLHQINRAKPTQVKINDSYMEIDSPLPLNSEPKINYIGLLHEHCAQKSIIAPQFIEVNSWGPSHKMNFTIRCQVADIIEEATATTKKDAKSDAAKKVWFKIPKMRFDSTPNKTIEQKIRDEVGLEIKNLKSDEVLPDYSKEHQAAKDNYLNLTNLKPCAFINGKETLENCHNLIASDYSLFLRKNIIAQLSEITKAQENIHLLPNYKSIVENVAKIMGVELQKIMLHNKKSIGEFTVAYKLKTKPPIVNICSAKTEFLADFQSIVGIAKDCQIFLC